MNGALHPEVREWNVEEIFRRTWSVARLNRRVFTIGATVAAAALLVQMYLAFTWLTGLQATLDAHYGGRFDPARFLAYPAPILLHSWSLIIGFFSALISVIGWPIFVCMRSVDTLRDPLGASAAGAGSTAYQALKRAPAYLLSLLLVLPFKALSIFACIFPFYIVDAVMRFVPVVVGTEGRSIGAAIESWKGLNLMRLMKLLGVYLALELGVGLLLFVFIVPGFVLFILAVSALPPEPDRPPLEMLSGYRLFFLITPYSIAFSVVLLIRNVAAAVMRRNFLAIPLVK